MMIKSGGIIARVVAVTGACNADLNVGDAFLMEELRITPLAHNKACSYAFASLVASLGRLKLQGGPVCVSCPDPATGVGGNVLFELSTVEHDANDQQ